MVKQKESTELRVITFDNSIKVIPMKATFDKQKFMEVMKEMPEDELTSGFFRKLEDEAVQIGKRLAEPIVGLRADIAEVIAFGRSLVAEATKRKAEAEAIRIIEKTAIVVGIIDTLKADYDLPDKYLNAVVLKDEYKQKGKSELMIRVDVKFQLDTQKSLYQGALDAEELRNSKIKIRELIIRELNTKYELDCTYSDYTIDRFSDDGVKEDMLNRYNNILAQVKAKAEAQAIAETKALAKQAEALAQAQQQALLDATNKSIAESFANDDLLKKHPHGVPDIRTVAEKQAQAQAHLQQQADLKKPIVDLFDTEPEVKAELTVFVKIIQLSSTDEDRLDKAIAFFQTSVDKSKIVKMEVLSEGWTGDDR